MEILTAGLLFLVPVVIGLVAVLRTAGLPVRVAPLTAIVLGILGAVALQGFSAAVVIAGIVIGLSASGLYSGTKTTITS